MVHTTAALTADLRRLGIAAGDLVMVHVSLRAVGPTQGRADGLVRAVLDALGPHGTMLMVLGADPDEPFDAQTTEVDVEDLGTFAEVFRVQPGVSVSDHAAARMAATGPLAPSLLSDPPLHDYYGPGSTLHRFVEQGGKVLRLGADLDTVTLTHHAEYLADIPDKRRVRRRYVRADTGEQWIDSLDDSDGIGQWQGGDYFPQILIDFIAEGHARTGTVGSCRAELVDGPAFVAFAVAWMNTHMGSPNDVGPPG